MRLRFLILMVALFCAGCLPVRWQDTLPITGSVVDATSQQPIVGARLQYAHFPKPVVYTGTGGHYDFPAISHLGFFALLPIDRFHPAETLTIEATGYVSTNVIIFGLPNTTNHIEFYLNHE